MHCQLSHKYRQQGQLSCKRIYSFYFILGLQKKVRHKLPGFFSSAAPGKISGAGVTEGFGKKVAGGGGRRLQKVAFFIGGLPLSS